MTGGRLTYNVEEAAQILGIGRTLMFQLIREGRIPSIRLGKRRLIARTDLEAFIIAHREEAA